MCSSDLPPTQRYQDGKDQLLEYPRGYWGQATYMARLGPDGKLISYEQVLNNEKFTNIAVGRTTKEQVLRQVGSPIATSYLSLKELEVWSYPYKESGAWNSVMHVHFDKDGIVHSLQNGPDLRFDRDGQWPFGMLGL